MEDSLYSFSNVPVAAPPRSVSASSVTSVAQNGTDCFSWLNRGYCTRFGHGECQYAHPPALRGGSAQLSPSRSFRGPAPQFHGAPYQSNRGGSIDRGRSFNRGRGGYSAWNRGGRNFGYIDRGAPFRSFRARGGRGRGAARYRSNSQLNEAPVSAASGTDCQCCLKFLMATAPNKGNIISTYLERGQEKINIQEVIDMSEQHQKDSSGL